MNNENHQGSEFEPFTLTLQEITPPVSEEISAKLASLKGKNTTISITILTEPMTEEEAIKKMETLIQRCSNQGINIKSSSIEQLPDQP